MPHRNHKGMGKKKKKKKNKIVSKIGHAVFETVGGALGATAGGAIGSFEAPIVGTIAGGVVGEQLGEYGGEKLADAVFGKGLSARPIQARPKGTKIRRPQQKTNVLINTNGRYSTQTFGATQMRGKGMRMRGRGREVRQGTFGTVSSEFGKVRF